jgi:WD repeat-containing protein 26
MCQSSEDLKAKAEWDGAHGQSRQQLLSELSSTSTDSSSSLSQQALLLKSSLVPCDKTDCLSGCISPSVMIPENRLAILLQQIKQAQISNCIYHNTEISPSLYSDHRCDRNNFPLRVVLELDRHSGEVWNIQFSHDGSRLATCGSDGTAIIYDVSSFEVLHVLADHQAGVCSVAWSPDDKMLVTCSMDRRARLWDSHVGSYFRHSDDGRD